MIPAVTQYPLARLGIFRAFRYTAQLRSGLTERQLRDALVASDEATSNIARVYRGILTRDPTGAELSRWQGFLRRGGTYEQFIGRLAG